LAREVASRLEPAPSTIRYLSRRAAVVRSGSAVCISSPALIRVERQGNHPSALLAIWGHPHLGRWLAEFLEPPPAKCWEPDPGAKLPVVLAAGTAGVLLHELIGHLAESDLVAAGASPLSGLTGATITAVTLDIVDDPTRTDLPGAFDHDDEGIRARPVSLVEGGRLCNFLCDRSGGEELGSDPGRGRRADWNRPPVTRQSNLVIAPGKLGPEELESQIEHGLVVTRVGGATVDPISSRTVLRVERGWEIRHGRRRHPLAPFELTGSALEILAGIDSRVGSDPTVDWRLGWCVKDGVPLATGTEAPTLIVHHLEVL
jgi:TldD protein